jgi:hypothetical protein
MHDHAVLRQTVNRNSSRKKKIRRSLMNTIAITLAAVVVILFALVIVNTIRAIRYSKSDACKFQERIERFVNREAA